MRHFLGFPPGLVAGEGPREQLEPAKLLVVEERPDGVFLIRYGADGSFAGDTWHSSRQEAQEQASFEFGELLTEWKAVASEMSDPILLLRLLSPT